MITSQKKLEEQPVKSDLSKSAAEGKKNRENEDISSILMGSSFERVALGQSTQQAAMPSRPCESGQRGCKGGIRGVEAAMWRTGAKHPRPGRNQRSNGAMGAGADWGGKGGDWRGWRGFDLTPGLCSNIEPWGMGRRDGRGGAQKGSSPPGGMSAGYSAFMGSADPRHPRWGEEGC